MKRAQQTTKPPLMPTSVRVGPFTYAIKPWNPTAADNAGCWGLCDKANLVILIKQGLPPQREAAVLIHEVTHAMYDSTEVYHAEAGEEPTVSVLSMSLTQVWRDNPQLIQYLEGALRST